MSVFLSTPHTRELERQSLPNAVPHSPPSNVFGSGKTGQRQQQAEKSQTVTAISVRERAQQSLEDTDRHLKAIDVRKLH